MRLVGAGLWRVHLAGRGLGLDTTFGPQIGQTVAEASADVEHRAQIHGSVIGSPGARHRSKQGDLGWRFDHGSVSNVP